VNEQAPPLFAHEFQMRYGFSDAWVFCVSEVIEYHE
jgi:hypothetical protein